ncbi:hypothetical protein ACQQ2Q_21445 [Agrobacterium sp. ES01]|uniref:hypothetical protein n=1 Tax=Agrobacterium sp. ES01 TaxID=3420714 RepID=UPI003D14CBB5
MKKTSRYGIDRENGKLRLGSLEMPFPRSRAGRIAVGVLFVLGGMLGFLPILGFWMIPVGLLILSQDLAFVRRRRRRLAVWWRKRHPGVQRAGR